MNYTVLYLNPRATADIMEVIRAAAPSGWQVLECPASGPSENDLRDSDFFLVADHPVGRSMLSAAPALRMIQHQGVGYERIDLTACRDRGIPVALTPEGTSAGVAEHTILLILAVYKRLTAAAWAVREGQWPQWELRARSYELQGKKLGLVGLGRIGREVARRALAFDAEVVFYDPWAAPPEDLPVHQVASFEELLSISDIVSLHVPHKPGNTQLINATALGFMKAGSILINTSRGSLVDETSLAAALDSGHLAGAGLDVLAVEPPPKDHPLTRHESVVVTPHIAAGTADALRAKMRAAFTNLERFARGQAIVNVVHELADLEAVQRLAGPETETFAQAAGRAGE